MDASKRTKRQIRELAAKTEELELRAALQVLADDFRRWEGGKIDSFELKDLIHRFDQGPARQIYLRYSTSDPSPGVAQAIANGMLDRATVPAEVLNTLEPLIAFMSSEGEVEQPNRPSTCKLQEN